MKPGLNLGIATGVPAFICLFFGLDEPESAFAALFVGVALALVWGLLLQAVRPGSAASILLWTVGGTLVGIASAVAAAAVTEGPENLAGGMILIVGSQSLGILGAIVGAIIGTVLHRRRSVKGVWASTDSEHENKTGGKEGGQVRLLRRALRVRRSRLD